jgi:hypothetical protein
MGVVSAVGLHRTVAGNLSRFAPRWIRLALSWGEPCQARLANPVGSRQASQLSCGPGPLDSAGAARPRPRAGP